MSEGDSHQPEPRKAEPDISFLPEVVAVESAFRTYRKPRYRARGPEVVPVEEAVEITVTTDAPFPERGLGPVVLIGRAQVTESERIGPNRYRFYAYDFEKLKEGTPIRIGWFGQPRPRRQTGFRFALTNPRGNRRQTE
jgi:hypothetical protein